MNAVTIGAAGLAFVLLSRGRSRAVATRLPTRRPQRRDRQLAVRGGLFVQQLLAPVTGGRRRAALRWELPTLAELLRMALAAGLTPTLALRVVTPLAPPASADVLARVMTGVDLGLGLDGALDPLREIGPDGAALSDALAASGHLGVPVEDALAGIGADARAGLRRAAEARARTVPVRLLFPLVLCVLPAFALLGVAPSLIAGLSG